VIGTLAAPLLRAACAPRAIRFGRSLDDCASAQRRTLARVLRDAAMTERGRALGLTADDDADAFRAKVPPVTYAELAPWIERTRSGERDVLVRGRVDRFEHTSGSGGATKLIAYNGALVGAFRSLFAIWAHDLLTHVLQPRSGRVFVSVSPDGQRDADYLGPLTRLMLAPFLVSPPAADAEHFRDALAKTLLGCATLEVISIWSPTYFLVLLAHIEAHRARFAPALRAARRRLLEQDPVPWTRVWPRLQLVSCWTAAAAAAPAQTLSRCLPHARLQGKGLLATEAPVTVPLVAAGGCVALHDEVFVELVAPDGTSHLLHEARDGHEYTLLLTQAAGLLRYRLGDRVRVTGRYRDAPLLEFVGREDAVSDLVGEKLSEQEVAAALRSLLTDDAFALLIPDADATPARYRIVTDATDARLAERLDSLLQRGYRYGEARALGQLAAPTLCALPDARRFVHDWLIADGMSAGDIKDVALLRPLARASRLAAALPR
jgi:hypothetical protein